jgi:hypothetical protein
MRAYARDSHSSVLGPELDFLRVNAFNTPSWMPLSCVDALARLYIVVVSVPFSDNIDEHIIASLFIFAFVWAFGRHLQKARCGVLNTVLRDLFAA